MTYAPDQIEELKQNCKSIAACEEAGVGYLLLTDFVLPDGCTPDKCDLLFCPKGRDNYPSRLFFSRTIQSPFARNWNFNGRICERDWVAYSWMVKTTQEMRLAQLLRVHLDGLRRSE